MKNYQKYLSSLLLFGLLLNIHSIYGQTSNDVSIYNWFDKTVGKDNLDILNGNLHVNPYRTNGQNNMYFIEDKFEVGNVIYENQIYYNVNLKYDIYRDILVINPSEDSNSIGVNLISEKIQSFSIKNNFFVRVEKKDSDIPDFTTGYYEETKIAPDFVFYIKHHKNIQKNVNDNGITYNFKESDLYFIKLKNKIYKANTKGEIIKIFPEHKKEINGFYLMNREVKESDLNQFMKNLMKYINNSLLIHTK